MPFAPSLFFSQKKRARATGKGEEAQADFFTFNAKTRKAQNFYLILPPKKMAIYAAQIPTPLGPMRACCDEEALLSLGFVGADGPENSAWTQHPLLKTLREQADAYFAGELCVFEVPLKPAGTVFQNQVWELLRQIPYGVTRTYGELATQLGNVLAVRAVARANACNPIAILIPCHRVIGQNGRLTGYAGGLERKQRLLRMEGATLL